MKKWLPILVLGLTQFVMVLDGTVMNVSITEVVGDLGTTTSNMQLAIATFTLTMAALMLAGLAWAPPRAAAHLCDWQCHLCHRLLNHRLLPLALRPCLWAGRWWKAWGLPWWCRRSLL